MSGGILPWLGLALLLLITDQFTKLLVLGHYRLGDTTYITGFFNLVRAHNTGAAFSFLAEASGWQRWLFTGIAVAAVVFILFLLRSHAGQRLFCLALACILGGAVGNLVDRLLHGYVVDFLQFHWRGWYFPAFNIADSAITIGAVGLVLDELLRVRRSR
ncbi:MAG: signal peptidase II [Ramlibacter sp.]